MKPRGIRLAGYMARMSENRNAHKLLVGKSEAWKRQLRRRRLRREDNSKMNFNP
jgi:hypothetical protein